MSDDATLDEFAQEVDGYENQKSQNWSEVKLQEVVYKRSENVDPQEVYLDKHVGLEHIEPNSPIPDWESLDDLSSTKRKFESGDILFAKLRPNLEKAAQPEFDGVASTDIFPIVAEQDINQKYLLYRLSSKPAFDYARRTSAGTRMPRTSWNLFNNFEFGLPPLSEQRKIATVLHTVDQAIQKAEKIVESIERAKRGVLQDTIFDVDSKESVDRRFGPKIFKIPEHWQRVRLQEVTDLITRGKQPTYADEGVPVINQECIYWDGFHFENIRYLNEKKAKEWKDKYFVSVGDVVINSTGRGTLGRAQTYAEDIERAVDSHVTIARPDTEKMTAGYLRYFLESNRGQGLLYSMCVTGSTGQIELSKSKLQLLSIPLPTKEEQKEIVNTLEQFDSNIRSQQKYKKQLDTLKQGLMQDLLSGEVRTTDVDIDIPEEVAKYG